MKAILILFILVISTSVYSQNVGINKTDPAHPLDVNGNVNVGGKILINNIAGQAGQVLKTNSTGATTWANMCDYMYAVNFTQNSTFIVPAGVTRIMVELWGAGGGGASGGGGAAGMYVVGVRNVVPGASISVTLGVGGNAEGGLGTTTTVTGDFVALSASGGNGANASNPGYAYRYGTSGAEYIQFIGQAGDANTFTYVQKNATTFAIIRKYGDGGAAGPDFTKRSQGETRSFNENTGVLIEANNPTFAPFPGGGGGGGATGEPGSNGMVVIRY